MSKGITAKIDRISKTVVSKYQSMLKLHKKDVILGYVSRFIAIESE